MRGTFVCIDGFSDAMEMDEPTSNNLYKERSIPYGINCKNTYYNNPLDYEYRNFPLAG